MKKLALNNRLAIIFSFLAASAIVLGILTYRNNKVVEETQWWVSHTREVLIESEKVLSYVKEFGNASRGYAIAADSAFLKNYFIAKDSLWSTIERLNRLIREDQIQKARLDSLLPIVNRRIRFSEENMLFVSQGKQAEAMQRIATRKGGMYMDTIRAILQRIQTHEQFLLAQRKSKNEESKNVFSTSFYFLLVSLISMIGFAFVTIRKEYKYRLKTEAELHHRSELYSQTLISLGDGVIATDVNGIITLLNNSAVNLTGWQRQEAIGKHITHVFKITHESTGLTVVNPVIAAMQENAIRLLANHTVLTRKDGSQFFIDDSGAPIHDLQGKVIGGVLVFRDITDKKNAEDKLKASESKFRVYFENSMAGVMLTSPNGSIMGANPAACEILGMNEAEICERGRGGIVDMSDPRILEFIAVRAREGKASGEHTLIRKNGTRFPAYVSSAVFDTVSGEKGTILIFEDITERKKAEEQIREMNKHLEELVKLKTKEVYAKDERFRHALDNMMEGVWILDFDWRYIYLNDVALKQSGFATDKIIGKTIFECYPNIEKSEVFVALSNSMKMRTAMRMDNQAMSTENESRWYNLSILPVPEGLFILTTDITARKQAEQKLKEYTTELELANADLKKANSELDRFVYSVSHDLRAPLTSMLGLLNIIEKEVSVNAGQHEAKNIHKILMLKKSALRLDNFIADILDYSRNARTQLTNDEVNFNELLSGVEENMRPMIDGTACELTVKINQSIPFASDKRRISIVLNNLISNGIKFRDMNKSSNFVLVNVDVNEKEAIIEVADNGIGIDDRDQGKIFEMFQRMSNQHPGSGLGLYIVKEVIEKLNGSITLTSNIGTGSKFIVRIPNMA